MATAPVRAFKIRALIIEAFTLGVMMTSGSFVYAAETIEERRPADPQGSVEIVDIAGSIELSAWDRPEVEVTGTKGDNVERVDVTSAGSKTVIHVVSRSGFAWNSGAETRLAIHVPAKSAVSATVVSANVNVNGVQGDVKIRSVSGNVSGNVDGNVRANTVNGSIRLTARGAGRIEAKTISGGINLTGGSGEVEVTTVSGDAKMEFGTLTRGRFKSISGNLSANLSLAPDAQLDGESVSGAIQFDFPAAPSADFDIQSFSGRIDNCFGPKPLESLHGPGSRLAFKNGDGHARVRVETKSGDVQLCANGTRHQAAAGAPVVRCGSWTDYLYVI